METGNLIDPEFLMTVREQFRRLRVKNVQVHKRDIVLSDTNRKSWGVVRELSERARKVPGARMSKQEEMILAGFSNWLVQAWHDLHGTDPNARPKLTSFYAPSL